jgi:hypothetical protein
VRSEDERAAQTLRSRGVQEFDMMAKQTHRLEAVVVLDAFQSNQTHVILTQDLRTVPPQR